MMQFAKNGVAAMIIGMGLTLGLSSPANAQLWGGGPVTLPTPTAFVTQMELGDLRQAEAWLEEGDWAVFLAGFRERGKARCRIAARVCLPEGGEATTFSGRFVALAKA